MINFFKNSFRGKLVIMLIFLQLLTVASILFLSRVNIDRLMIDSAYSDISKTIEQSVDHTQSFIDPAHKTIGSLKTLADNNVINFNDSETVEKLFFSMLQENSHFAGVFIGNDSGDFIYMLRNEEPEISGETFQTKIIENSANDRSVFFRWKGDDFHTTREEQVTDYDYDPRIRPWYLLAQEQQKTAWTEPYTFFTSKKPGITIAAPILDKVTNQQGVIGIDIELEELSAFLDRINTNDAYIQIIDDNKNLIAESSFPNILSDTQIHSLLNDFSNSENNPRKTFIDNEEEYLFIHQSLKEGSKGLVSPTWEVFAYTQTQPFLVKVRNIEKQNILIAITTLFMSILLSILIANKTSKPVEQWINEAKTDPLTQLHNRNYFFAQGRSIYSNYLKKQNHHLALLMIDIDYFKDINDKHGHAFGDSVLKTFSDFLKSAVREEDVVARYGGEEFIVLAEVLNKREAMQFADRLRESVENYNFVCANQNINLTVSIGVSVTDHQIETNFEEFIKFADQALYDSKGEGRNRVTIAA